MTPRPRLLFVSPRFLFPADEGGKIRTSNILRCLKGGAFDITLASPAPPDLLAFRDALESVCDRFVHWPQARPSPLRRAAALLSRLPVSVATDRSAAGSATVSDALAAGADVVVTDFPHAAVLLPPRVDAVSVLFTHNVEAEIYERHAAVARGAWRPVWRAQARKMAAFEGAVCRRHDATIAVSERDAVSLQKRYGIAAPRPIVTGVDLEFFAAAPPPRAGNTVVFTGVMDSPANIDGVTFLIRHIWPLVVRARPDARAVVVGRNPPASLVALAHGTRVEFTGFVDDIRPYLAAADLAVIPLRVGGGTRIKAFEAMAVGRPVISTTVGVEGLGLSEGEHFVPADTASDFAAAILRLLADPASCDRLARTARTLLEERYSWAEVARQFEAICGAALARHEPTEPAPWSAS